ncbi:MAG: UDP-N-acetylmuramate dehydrogenase [Simkaniaceae bacterium]|nr:UDP-N-acetylmuramate dehydrogenase [Simkaniaceae bacterium]
MLIESQIQRNKYLKDLTTFKVGGPAQELVLVDTIEMMLDVMQYIRKKKILYMVLGKGSNCLFDDKGFPGLIVLNKINFFQEKGSVFEVGAGFSYSHLGVKTARKGWSGLEFASGIPGTVGGAVYMNAGANGMETKDSLSHVSYIDEEGKLIKKAKKDLTFSYRSSSFHQMQAIIVSAEFALTASKDARARQIEIVKYRAKTQPFGENSAGCIFRNPKIESAGALIEKCGLKGISVGNAKISLKHGNFIINEGDAKSCEIAELISKIQAEVKMQTGCDLEVEIKRVPNE